MLRLLIFPTILFFSLTFSVYGDVVIKWKNINNKSNTVDITKGYLKNDKVRIDFYRKGKELKNSMIYNQNSERIIHIDHENKTYTVMDKETMRKISEKLNNVMAEFEKQLKNLPPEQREMMKKYMKKNISPHANYVEPVIKKSGKGKVNGIPCVKYDVYKEKKRTRQYCITSWDKVEGGAEIATAMKNLSSFFQEWTKTMSKSSSPIGSRLKFEKNLFAQIEKLNGLPLETLEFENGKLINRTIFESSERKEIPDSIFTSYRQYKRQEIRLD